MIHERKSNKCVKDNITPFFSDERLRKDHVFVEISQKALLFTVCLRRASSAMNLTRVLPFLMAYSVYEIKHAKDILF